MSGDKIGPASWLKPPSWGSQSRFGLRPVPRDLSLQGNRAGRMQMPHPGCYGPASLGRGRAATRWELRTQPSGGCRLPTRIWRGACGRKRWGGGKRMALVGQAGSGARLGTGLESPRARGQWRCLKLGSIWGVLWLPPTEDPSGPAPCSLGLSWPSGQAHTSRSITITGWGQPLHVSFPALSVSISMFSFLGPIPFQSHSLLSTVTIASPHSC